MPDITYEEFREKTCKKEGLDEPSCRTNYKYANESRWYDNYFLTGMRTGNKPASIRLKMNIFYGISIVLFGLFVAYLSTTVITSTPLLGDRKTDNLALFVVLGALFGVIGSIYSWFGKYDKQVSGQKLDDVTLVDIWSVGHFFFHVIIVLAFNYFLGNYWLSFGISIFLGIIFEIFEYIFSFVRRLKTIYAEHPINSIGDLVFGTIGSFVAFFFI